ncbi:MAG: PAS domain S-box protein, partial [Pseudomonadota bacterium]
MTEQRAKPIEGFMPADILITMLRGFFIGALAVCLSHLVDGTLLGGFQSLRSLIPGFAAGGIVGALCLPLVHSRRRGRGVWENDQAGTEAKYRMIFEHSPVGVFHFDGQGVVTACNEKFVEIIGSGKESLVGLDMPQRLRDESIKAAVKQALSGELVRYKGDYQSVTASKTTPVNCVFGPLTDRVKGITGGIGIIEDETERQRAEKELAESERRLRHLVEKATDVILVTDVNGSFTLVNPVALEVTGYQETELMGMHYLDLVAPAYRDAAAEFYERQLGERTPDTHYELPIVTRTGQTVWLGQKVQLVTEQGKVLGFQSICRDITARKRAEEALRKSEERFRTLAQAAPFGIAVIGQSGDIEYLNPEFTDMLGYTSDDIPDEDTWFLKAYPDPAVRRRIFDLWVATIKDCRETGKIGAMILHVQSREGSEKAVSLSIAVLGDGRRIVAYKDITERELERAELERTVSLLYATVEATADGILVVGGDGVIKLSNRRFADFRGFSGEALIGARPDEALNSVKVQLKNAHVLDARMSLLEAEPDLESFDTLEFKDGRVMEVLSKPQRVRDHVVGRVWSFRDVTRRERASRALRESEQRLDIALMGAGLGIWEWDPRSDEVGFSRRWAEILGFSGAEKRGNTDGDGHATLHEITECRPWDQLLHEDDKPWVMAALREHLEGRGPATEVEHRMKTQSGVWKWVLTRGKMVTGRENGKTTRAVGTYLDISKRKAAEHDLERSKETVEALLNATNDYVFLMDVKGRFLAVNQSAAEKLGRHPNELIGKPASCFLPKRLVEEEMKMLDEVAASRRILVREEERKGRFYVKTFFPVLDPDMNLDRIAVFVRDVTHRKQSDKEREDLIAELEKARVDLEFQATHDPLTGLLNRSALLAELNRELVRARPGGGPVGVVIADVDYFKAVNDTHGHLVGDAVLRAIAGRIMSLMRPYDIVGRYGGEEFIIVLPMCDRDSVKLIPERIRLSLSKEPINTGDGEFAVTMSFGVTAV